jgi:hypothetical protein
MALYDIYLPYTKGAYMVIELVKRAPRTKKRAPTDVHKELAERNACYVLITCGQPSAEGKMEVEMTYEGDVSLAAYLIESAQSIIDNQEETS